MRFSDLVRRAREEMGLSQLEAADRVGVSHSVISRWETGHSVPSSPETVNRLVMALGLSAEEVLRSLGYRLAPPSATRLPRELLEHLLALSPEQQRLVLDLLRAIRRGEAIGRAQK